MWGKKKTIKKTTPTIDYTLVIFSCGDNNEFHGLTKEKALEYSSNIEKAIKSGTPKIINISDTNLVIEHISSWKIKLEIEIE